MDKSIPTKGQEDVQDHMSDDSVSGGAASEKNKSDPSADYIEKIVITENNESNFSLVDLP